MFFCAMMALVLRHGAGLHQPRLPIEIEIGLLQRRLMVGEIGLLHRGVELDEPLALLDVLAAVEEILGDEAAQLRGDVNAFDGDDGADRAHAVGPALGPGGLGRHRRRRRHHLRHELADHIRLEDEVEPTHPAKEQADDDGGYDEALNHACVACSPRARGAPTLARATLAIGEGQIAPPAAWRYGIPAFLGFANRFGRHLWAALLW